MGSRLPFFVGFQRRLDNNFVAMREAVKRGDIGQVSVIYIYNIYIYIMQYGEKMVFFYEKLFLLGFRGDWIIILWREKLLKEEIF